MDTDFLISALRLDGDVDTRDTAADLLWNKTPPFARVSLPVMGEFLAKIVTEDAWRGGLDRAIATFGESVRDGRLSVWPAGRGARPAEVAAALHRADPRLDPTDVLVVAFVCADPESQRLYTTDAQLIQSEAVAAILNEHGKTIREPGS